ncbi:hypothetical protein NW762_008838 [Fusarium torreyae]|uniref:Uncharacterized protein n=1 Tax=Fusarium torreyae TaxID=1237075 RepID=A0A9W8VCW4_9HYPO|nr:hypothetical protein NW762_008838 [Fusarium torreyae]
MAMRAREEHHDTGGRKNRSAREPKRKSLSSSHNDINDIFSDQICRDLDDIFDCRRPIVSLRGTPRVHMSGATNDTSLEDIREMLEPIANDIASIKKYMALFRQNIASIRQDIASIKKDSSSPPNSSSAYAPRSGQTDSPARFDLKPIPPFDGGTEFLEGFPSMAPMTPMAPMPHYAAVHAGYGKPTYSRQTGDITHKNCQRLNFSP